MKNNTKHIVSMVFAVLAFAAIPLAHANLMLELSTSDTAGLVKISDNNIGCTAVGPDICDSDTWGQLGLIGYNGSIGAFDVTMTFGESKPYIDQIGRASCRERV